MKKCADCKQLKDELEFIFVKKKSGKKLPGSYCKVCHTKHEKLWRTSHKDKREQIRKSSYEKHKIYYSDWKKTKAKELKNKFFEMYGNVCSCCGEFHIEFLTLDHINGQKRGKRNKEPYLVAYSKAVQEFNPKEYRTLCMNCNHSLGTKGYCPHQTSI